MCKSLRNKELTVVIARKSNGDVLAKSGRTDTYIHRYIQYFACEDSHKFGLSDITLLKMKSTQNTIAGKRFIVLHKTNIDVEIMQSLFVP